MNLIQLTIDAVAAAGRWIYAATNSEQRRRLPSPDRRAEDGILNEYGRPKATANARDLARNFSIVAWAIRKHLSYVSRFRFQGVSADKGLKRDVEAFIRGWSNPNRCDVAGRHSLPRLIRLLEQRAILDGDCGLVLVKDGRMQAVEGDRVADPPGGRALGWRHGVRTDAFGRAMEFAVHSRTWANRTLYERKIPAAYFILHGYFDRIDQTRGISPILSAVNSFRDVYEELDYAHAASKVRQLFALVFTRNGSDAAGEISATEDAETGRRGYTVDFGTGPQQIDLDPGDEVKFLESNHPSSQFQDFTQLSLGLALKSLDIPYSMYDESFTNFFGSRTAWLSYDECCQDKRDALRGVLDRLTEWRLALAFDNGELMMPSAKIAPPRWDWIPAGMPWWDPAKEIAGEVAAVRAGFTTPQRICRQRGTGDFYDNVDEIAEAIAYAREKGVPVSFDPDPTLAAIATAEAAEANAQPQNGRLKQ